MENCLKTWLSSIFHVLRSWKTNPRIDFANTGIVGPVKWSGIETPNLNLLPTKQAWGKCFTSCYSNTLKTQVYPYYQSLPFLMIKIFQKFSRSKKINFKLLHKGRKHKSFCSLWFVGRRGRDWLWWKGVRIRYICLLICVKL